MKDGAGAGGRLFMLLAPAPQKMHLKPLAPAKILGFDPDSAALVTVLCNGVRRKVILRFH